MPEPELLLDTASLRPPTGFDVGARALILRALEGIPPSVIVEEFFGEDYADFDDYLRAVHAVRGEAAVDVLCAAVKHAPHQQSMVVSQGTTERARESRQEATLLHMPEADFRHAVYLATRGLRLHRDPAARISEICRHRGIPWTFSLDVGFSWVGDHEVETLAIEPALSALSDLRLGGARNHFETARSELGLETPSSLRQSVLESASAVEGSMKVALGERGVHFDPKDSAFTLFDHLVKSELVPRHMQDCVLAAAKPRNALGAHGAGAKPLEVPQGTAEAVLAAAAVSIAYLQTLLP